MYQEIFGPIHVDPYGMPQCPESLHRQHRNEIESKPDTLDCGSVSSSCLRNLSAEFLLALTPVAAVAAGACHRQPVRHVEFGLHRLLRRNTASWPQEHRL